MKVSKLTPNISVAHQLVEKDLEEAAAAGFKAIINNRPDGEAPDQPRSEELSATAKRLGLVYHHIPVVPGQISTDQVEAFRTALGNADKPALAFCRTGTRSATLWALAASDRLSPNEILQTTSEAGYDLEALRPRLEAAVAANSQPLDDGGA
ncbi:TIGR01244 family sulfur transferase [Microvirga sp. 17 mud 1-3]|uniref:TIGR01244 family sulfur transferase n=1 Tax=Microvirga sp. 17 mud 1-3 TaxID=2082949 RepID=UPI000D6AB803|nr:TIGR01244 family sulfur transferase [Microvirga sp. 17 mud 1-3]AWM87701.1 TIGR01244 family phosphatase [Microvirga sp. 17 mud 1-3]